MQAKVFKINNSIYTTDAQAEVITIDCNGGSLHIATDGFSNFSAEKGRIATKKDTVNETKNHFGRIIQSPSGISIGDFIPEDEDVTILEKDGIFYTFKFDHFNGHFTAYKSGVWNVDIVKLKKI